MTYYPPGISRDLFDQWARAPREPISTAIALTAFISSTFAVSTAVAGAIGGALLSIGASVALSAASTLLTRSRKQSSLAGGQGVAVADQQALRQPQIGPIPEQRLVLGTVTSSGVLIWRRYQPPYLWHVYLIAAHKCGKLLSVRLNGKDVSLSPSGLPDSPPYLQDGVSYLEVSYRDGDDDQLIDPIIARDFPAMPATFRHRGFATVVVKANYGASDAVHKAIYGADFNFNPLFRFEGARYFDPRRSTCYLDDPSSWVNGSTASLNIARYLYHPWPNTRLVDPVTEIDWEKMKRAADIDDRWAGRKDGSRERNHTCDGIILSTADPTTTLREMLTSNDGLLIQNAGKYHVLSGAPSEPVGTLHQDMLAGGFSIQNETPDRELINIIKPEFVSPERDYKPQVGPVNRRDDFIATDGRPIEITESFPFTEGDARAQRLTNRKMIEVRGGNEVGAMRRSFTGVFTLEARKYRAGDIVNVWFRDFPAARMVIRITKTSRDETMQRVIIEGVSWTNERFVWHAPTDQKDFTLSDEVLAA